MGAAALALCAGGVAQADVVGVFHENFSAGDNTLFVFGAEGTAGTISGLDGLDEMFTIGADGVFVRNFGSRGREIEANGAVSTLSFRVTSDEAVSALALNRAPQTTDMTVLLDVDALGRDYVVLAAPGVFGSGSQMSVTAVEDGTQVTVTSDLSLAGNPAGVPFALTLNAGETVFYESGGSLDLSGTRVTADKDVAVFAGAECTQVPVGVTACDHLISQQFDTSNFDTNFLISDNFGGGADGDLLRITTATDGTEVFLDGVSQGTIDAGEVLVIDNVTEGRVTSSEPVTVGQFVRGQGGTRTTGDPAFAILPSVDQQLDSYAFATPIGADVFGENYLNIAIAEADAGTLLLDGLLVDTSGFTLKAGTLFGNVPILPGFGTIEAANAFLATISGFSSFDSYFTPIATAFSPGVSPPPPPPPMSVIPLPATGLLLLGALGLGGLAGRRRRAAA